MKRYNNYLGFVTIAFIALKTGIAFGAVLDQKLGPEVEEKKDKSKIEFTTGLRIEYNDNVFKLSENEKRIFNEKNASDAASGRLRDMDVLYEFIASPEIEMDWLTRGLSGKKFELKAGFKYNIYLANSSGSYPEGNLILGHNTGWGGKFKLKFDFYINYFRQNSFSAGTDANSNGDISKDERTYSRQIYSEYETIFSYRQKLMSSREQGEKLFHKPEMGIEPLFGFCYRGYKDPFENRDRKIFIVGSRADLKFFWMDFDLEYKYEKVFTSNGQELILVDETVSGADSDLNVDGMIGDDAPLTTNIDRSRQHEIVDIEAKIKFAKRWRFDLGYRFRGLKYDTDNALDIDRYEQEETRHTLDLGLRRKFSKRWTGKIYYQMVRDTDYKQNVIGVYTAYTF